MIKWKKKCNCKKCKQKVIEPLIHLINEEDIIETNKATPLYSPEKSLLTPLQPSEPVYYSNFYNSNDIIQIVKPGESINFPLNGPSNCFIFRLKIILLIYIIFILLII